MKISYTLSFILILLFKSILSLACLRKLDYDGFDNCELELSADKNEYRTGDTVKLTFKIRATDTQTIRLCKSLWESVKINIRSYANGHVDTEDAFSPTHISTPESSSPDRSFEKLRLGKGDEITRTITGDIKKNDSDSGCTFDFGKFGIFQKGKLGTFAIWLYCLPRKPNPSDSLEDYSNTILIKVLS